MKKLFSIVIKLSAKGFAEPHSDRPKLIFGSHALVRGMFPLELFSIFNAIRFESFFIAE